MKSTNVILIGPMGVGKTTIGKALARLLHLEFFDSDSEIEARTGVSISLIFEIEGEKGFRDREQKMIEELSAREGIVLATGGGSILREQSRQALRKSGTVVYLEASIEQQWNRTRHSKNRPLLQGGNGRETLQALMRERDPLYRQEADLIVRTDGRSPKAVARDIARKLEEQ